MKINKYEIRFWVKIALMILGIVSFFACIGCLLGMIWAPSRDVVILLAKWMGTFGISFVLSYSLAAAFRY